MKSVRFLCEIARQAGQIGLEYQRKALFAEREFKQDGSVVTSADREIEDFLCHHIAMHSPDCNFVTEERVRSYRPNEAWTFVIDPIDGTDCFSNGMHTWCISIGVLDSSMLPVAGIIYAPRLDFLLFADIDQPAMLGSMPLRAPEAIRSLTSLSTIILSSRVHQQMDLRAFPGKIRAFGTAAMHLSMPAVYPSVVAAIQDNKAFAWDIAGAHGILRSLACDLQCLTGRALNYRDLASNNWRVPDFLVAGKPGATSLLMPCIRMLGGSSPS